MIKGLHLEEFEVEGKRLDLWAGGGQWFSEQSLVTLHDVRVEWTSGKIGTSRKIAVVGGEAEYDLAKKTAVIRGGVRVLSDDDYTMETQLVHYDAAQRKIVGPGGVRMEGPGWITEGVGLSVDIDKEKVRLAQNVRTTIPMTSDGWSLEVLK